MIFFVSKYGLIYLFFKCIIFVKWQQYFVNIRDWIKIHANFFATTLDIVEVIYRFFTLATVMHFDFVSAQILVDDWGLKLDLLDKHRKILAKFCQTQA